MSLREQMQDDVFDVFLQEDEHAEEITYTPAGESARTLLAIVRRDEQSAANPFPDGRHRVRHARIQISTEDTAGVAAPREGDVVTLAIEGGTADFRVTGTPLVDGYGMQSIELIRVEADEKSSQGYRIVRG